jgi:glutamine synthetase
MTGPTPLPPGTVFVDAFVFDINGIARGKRLPAEDWDAASSGVAFSASALVLDAQGNAQGPLGIGTQDGDPDSLGLAVPGQIVPVPWAAESVAQSLLDMRGPDGSLWFDPRQVLAGVLARCRADGLHPVVACELEFYLVHVDRRGRPAPPRRSGGGAPYGSAGHLSLDRLEDDGAFLHRLHQALAVQGIQAGTLVSEYGPGQFEVNLRHTPDPLLAADQAALLRRATAGVAAAMGLRASFMAKPYPDHPGNGLHVHVSLVDQDGRNRFGAAGGQALLENAVGGMQALHAQSMAIFAPSFSAYRRYRAGAFVSLDGGWGENDRRVAFRIPSGGASSRRVEHRVACADASPHLVMAAILAGLHHGITTGCRPVADTLPPRDLTTALAAFESGVLLHRYLPPDFAALFAAVKRGEMAALHAAIHDAEWLFYL